MIEPFWYSCWDGFCTNNEKLAREHVRKFHESLGATITYRDLAVLSA